MHQALLYEKLKSNMVRCLACHHFCSLKEGQIGRCRVRQNIKGKFYSLVYGQLRASHVDPIEKKPLFHFLPGSLCFSIATLGCNFKCLNCQNYEISQIADFNKTKNSFDLTETPPIQIIKSAKENNCTSVAYTYSEPTVFIEYAYAVMRLASKNNLKNVWVSNGYFSEQTLDLIAPYLDAVNIDLKFFTDQNYLKICGAHLEPILKILQKLKRLHIWIEITTLIIPTLNNSQAELKAMAKFIYTKLGADTPWHLSAFFPTYKLAHLAATPPDIIEQAYNIGKQTGLYYVYAGNISTDDKANTTCPNCQSLIIWRQQYKINRFDQNGHCPHCHQKIDLIL